MRRAKDAFNFMPSVTTKWLRASSQFNCQISRVFYILEAIREAS